MPYINGNTSACAMPQPQLEAKVAPVVSALVSLDKISGKLYSDMERLVATIYKTSPNTKDANVPVADVSSLPNHILYNVDTLVGIDDLLCNVIDELNDTYGEQRIV